MFTFILTEPTPEDNEYEPTPEELNDDFEEFIMNSFPPNDILAWLDRDFDENGNLVSIRHVSTILNR